MKEKLEKNNEKNIYFKMKRKNAENKRERGITLVALVVTIVVLLILAGVSINLVLGDNGIIKKAKEAKEKSEQASQNDVTAIGELDQQLDTVLAENDYTKQNTKVMISGEEVWIPEGFKISNDSASTVQGGMVIEDKDGNQFVWIPVASISEYKRTWYCGDDSFSAYSETLPSDEKISIETYKGYYIGRYEAGDKNSTEASTPTLRTSNSGTSNKVSIKKGQAPYNYVTKTQAQSLSENFGTQQNYNASIKTKLVSSYAWDTAIAFIQKAEGTYGTSSPQGNYINVDDFDYVDITGIKKTKSTESSVVIPTGQTTPACNIYDMGGNVWEWTTEFCSHTGLPCTAKGGSYGLKYAYCSAGFRSYCSDTENDRIGFRLALFL